jgi:hypothetical protein
MLRSSKYQFYNLWNDTTRAETHDLLYSSQALFITIIYNINAVHRIKSFVLPIYACSMNAFFSFNLFTVYIPESKQQLRIMIKYTQIQDIARFKPGL